MGSKKTTETEIIVKTSRKWSVVKIHVPDEEPIRALETPTGVTVLPLSETKRMGLYHTITNLIKDGKMKRYNANGTVKITDKKTKVYIDLDEFEDLTEF